MNTVTSGSGVKSAPPTPLEKQPHEIEMDRKRALLQKVKSLRQGTLMQMGALQQGNSNKEYCWVNVRDDRRVSFEATGWNLCKDPAVVTRWKQEDGTHRRADLILYEIDRDLYEATMAYNQLRGIESVEGSEEMFIASLDRDRVPVYKPQVR